MVVAILIKSLLKIFEFWVLDAKMETGWEIGFEKNLKNAQYDTASLGKTF